MKNITVLTFGAVLLLCGCSKRNSTPIDTGRVLPVAAFEVGAFKPDTAYAEVNSAWLPGFYERFRADLFAKDVVKWEGRFDCNKFAAAYCAAAQLEFYRDKFHSWTPGQALAVGEVWYGIGGDVRRAHAIVRVITERGPLYIEPQTGMEVALFPPEERSIFFRRF